MARTGERYAAARAAVVADRGAGGDGRPGGSGMSVVELLDWSREAARAGMPCKVFAFPDVAEVVDGAALLARIREALRATESDPATEVLRSFMLLGRRPLDRPPFSIEGFERIRRFVARARAGIGGVSEGGRMLALHVAGPTGVVPVLCVLWQAPASPLVQREPCVLLLGPGEVAGPPLGWIGLMVP
jgi:hypothetical protein